LTIIKETIDYDLKTIYRRERETNIPEYIENGGLNSKSGEKVSISDTQRNAAELGLEQKSAARCASV